MTVITYFLTFLAIIVCYGASINNHTLQLPITISPLVQDAVQREDFTDALIQLHATFFMNVTFSDIIKNLKHKPVVQIRRHFAGMVVTGLAARSHGLTVEQFEFLQASNWAISLSVEELALVSSNITLPLTDRVPLIVIQEAMFKHLEKRFNFSTEEIAEHLGATKDEIYAFLEPGWIKVVNFITQKTILAMSQNYSISPNDIAAVFKMTLPELYNSTLNQLEHIKDCLIHHISPVEDTKCRICPYGTTYNVVNMKCECKDDHYIGDDRDGPCYTVPVAVQDLKFRILSDTSVKITWKKPLDNGDSYGPLTYTVECYLCFTESECDTTVRKAAFVPAKVNLNTTYVIVYNLTLNETYKLTVVSMNNLKNVPREKWKFSELKFTPTGCPIHYIRSSVEDKKCQRCPNGKTNNTKRTKCECKEDYYIGDNQDGPCYAVPLAVHDLIFRKLTDTSVNITWRKPKNDDDFYSPSTYIVECYHCTSMSRCDTTVKTAVFFFAKINLNTTFIIVFNLTLNETYKLKVISMNNLKNVPREKWKFSELNFTLAAWLSTKDHLWTTPLLSSDSTSELPSQMEPTSSFENVSFIVSVTTAGLVISFFILIVVYIRRKTRLLKKYHRHNEMGLENVAHDERNSNRLANNNGVYENANDESYVISDANSYQGNDENARFESPSHSVDMLWEFPRDCLTIERHLGEGRFGSVSKAKVTIKQHVTFVKHNIVAVKTLKENASLRDREDFLNEVDLMKNLEPHPHVVQLLGCCAQSDPHALILEYLSGGDLLGFLRKSRGHGDVYHSGECYATSSLTEKDLLSFAWMTADGMAYLAKNEIVHRDLAARNVLVGEGSVCKISDFGLARTGPYERTSKAWLPVKWMAPEDIFQGQCTSKSDVWSYGIMLWEIFTIGDSPYPSVKGRDVPALIQSGYRMPKPKHLSDDIYSIMLECWNDEPHERPLFDRITSYFFEKRDSLAKDCVDLTLYEEDKFVNFDASE